jgi:protein LSM14
MDAAYLFWVVAICCYPTASGSFSHFMLPLVISIAFNISGSRISLISKNNIRYEGTLYSINEADAQVALQNVKSYGTEGRELLDTTGASTYVPPNDVVHAYLLFRGQDIKDLHVHEKTTTTSDAVPPPATAAAPAPATTTTPANVASNTPAAPAPTTQTSSTRAAAAAQPADKENKQVVPDKTKSAPDNKDVPSKATRNTAAASNNNSGNNNKEQPKKTTSSANNGGTGRKNQNMVGTGASLLNRKARGAKGNQGECDCCVDIAFVRKCQTSPGIERIILLVFSSFLLQCRPCSGG